MGFGHPLTLCLGFSFIIFVQALGCFKCSSTNHSNVECEDPFTENVFYVSDCWAPRDNGIMLPATQCMKVTVTDASSGYSITVRDCLTDTVNQDSNVKFGRMSQYNWMDLGVNFNGNHADGSLEICKTDACNGGDKITWFTRTNLFFLIWTTVYIYV